MAEESKVEEDVSKCEHTGKLAYMTTTYTPFIPDIEVNMVAYNLFLCEDCNEVVTKKVVVPRSFLPDGSISDPMQKAITEIVTKQEVEKRVKDLQDEVDKNAK